MVPEYGVRVGETFVSPPKPEAVTRSPAGVAVSSD